jgi:hypothetical protein
MNEKRPLGTLLIVGFLAVVILALWFGVYFLALGRA